MVRSLWSGTIAFGLVNIPIRLYTAVRDKSVHFHMMSPDGSCRLRRKLYCPETGKEYDFSETSRGIEVAPDQYVILDKEEVRELKPEKGETLDIVQFVKSEEIDPIYFEKSYFIGPAKGGERAYELLEETLKKIDRVAVGRFVLRNKEHVVVLRHYDGIICLHTLNYREEIVPRKELPATKTKSKTKPTAQEVKLATELVKSMSKPFKPEQFQDRFKDELLELVEEKEERVPVSKRRKQKEPAPVLDLMKALKKSIGGTKVATDKRVKEKKLKTAGGR